MIQSKNLLADFYILKNLCREQACLFLFYSYETNNGVLKMRRCKPICVRNNNHYKTTTLVSLFDKTNPFRCKQKSAIILYGLLKLKVGDCHTS